MDIKRGILLDSDDDLKIERGALKIGNRKMQDAYLVLSANQGDFKEDPLAGANLNKMIRGGLSKEMIRKTIEISLERVGVRFEDIKNEMDILINKEKI